MIIYKQYDQASLNLQYNNRVQVPDHPSVIKNWEDESRNTEQAFTVIKDIAYGEALREKLDIYPSEVSSSKTLVFIHGGYWRNLDKSYFQFIAKAFNAYNLTIVIITYPLAPAVSVSQIVLSCRKAMRWITENIAKYNGDPGQIYLLGHSAGGHLATMMMTESKGFTPLALRAVLTMSGLFNLKPVQLSDINETLQIDEMTMKENSPVLLKPVTQCPLVITVGANETDEYKAQSKDLYDQWKNDLPVKIITLDGLNHFTIVGDVLNTNSVLHREVTTLLEINT